MTLDDIHPLSNKLLARPYTKPEKIGSIIVPETATRDLTLSLWEVVKCGSAVNDYAGFEIAPDDIIRTKMFSGVYTARIEGTDYYTLFAHDIVEVVKY